MSPKLATYPQTNLLLGLLPHSNDLESTTQNALQSALNITTQELTIFISLHAPSEVSWSLMQHCISHLYGFCITHSPGLTVDIIPLDFCAYTTQDMSEYQSRPTLVSGCMVPEWWPQQMHTQMKILTNDGTSSSSSKTALPWNTYSHVAVGGTFDHLHAGHKILLTATALAATQRVVCGISADALLENKKYKEYLEPFRTRELEVLMFLRKIRKDIIVELVPLVDPYGPTATDETIGALVVSQETLVSAGRLNERRKGKDMKEMAILSVDLLMEDPSSHEEVKISSTDIRAKLATKK